MQRDEVRAGEEFVELDFFDAKVSGALLRQEWIEGHDMHFEANAARGDDGANIAAADHAERLAGDLNAHEAVLLPLARLGREVRLGQVAGDGEHHGDGVFSGGDGIAERRVHHNNALARGSWNVHIVNANAGAADHFEICGSGNQLLGDFRRRADREAVVLADDFEQLVLVLAEVRQIIDFHATVFEDLNGGWGEFVRNEYAGRHAGLHKMKREMNSRETQLAASAPFCVWKAQSSHGSSASTSAVSTVAPHQMRRPAGASR